MSQLQEAVDYLLANKDKHIFIIGHDSMLPLGDELVALLVYHGFKAFSLNNIYTLAHFNYPFGYYQQIYTLAEKDDILIILSPHGVSKSLVQACHAANAKEMKTITFVGEGGGLFTKHQTNLNIFMVINLKEPIELMYIPYEIASMIPEDEVTE